MMYKKYSYLIILLLILTVGVKGVNASSKECFYTSEDGKYKSVLTLTWGEGGTGLSDFADIRVDKTGDNRYEMDNEHLNNWWGGGFFKNWYDQCTKHNKVCFEPYYKNQRYANQANNPACPKYIVFQNCSTYEIWGTESETEAIKATQGIRDSGCLGYYASAYKEDPVTGQITQVTEDEYYAEFTAQGLLGYDKGPVDCSDYEVIFGDKNDKDSLRYMINSVLDIVRVIVPILIILLGTIDLAKASLAGKEDTMKKAQNDFIKRVIIGVAVFFVPLLIDLVMDLADIVWAGEGYVHCGL